MNKVAVINFSGNVGKSSIARYLLAPRMECDVLTIESINDAGGQKKTKTTIRGKEITELREHLLLSDSLVVDIGASNVEDFIEALSEYDDGIEEFEYFVIPTVPAIKQQEDTVSTISTLSAMDVPREKIIVVFNQFDKKGGPLQKQFKVVFDAFSNSDACHLNKGAVVPRHGFFEAFQQDERSFDDVINDKTDYRVLISKSEDKSERIEYVRKLGMKSLALGINKELDGVYLAMNDG